MDEVRSELQKIANTEKATFLQRFFKTYEGGYAENDKFYGITVPISRTLAKKYTHLPLSEIKKLLQSPMHEERLIALFILVDQFKKGDEKTRETIFDFYLAHTKWVNNWDLVDSSAHKIIGAYLLNKPKTILYKLAKSKDLWERRIAMIATYQFILNGQAEETYKIAEILLQDKHDLIHKAVGWMLREAGKRDQKILVEFLAKYYKKMPRTALLYAIEKFPEEMRKKYILGTI